MQLIRPSQLSPTDLGDLGEDHFSKLCDLSGLTANKASRDRTGWDFVVQFPASDGEARQGYDLRPGSPTCLVQVKTATRPIKGIALRLSLAERLAKEPLPAFVCVVRIDEQYRVVETLLVHVFDEVLAQILKRLRKEFAACASNLNRKTILLRLPQTRIAVPEIPGAMAIAMTRACGADSQAYAQQKKLQLESVGFPINPYSITGKICGTLEEIVDLFLGLKGSAPIKDVAIHEDRFGIRLLSGPPVDSGRLEVEPTPVDECVLSLHFENEEPIAFELTVYTPGIPDLPEEQQKLLFKGKLFSFVVQGKTWTSFQTMATVLHRLRSGGVSGGCVVPSLRKKERCALWPEGGTSICLLHFGELSRASLTKSASTSGLWRGNWGGCCVPRAPPWMYQCL